MNMNVTRHEYSLHCYLGGRDVLAALQFVARVYLGYLELQNIPCLKPQKLNVG